MNKMDVYKEGKVTSNHCIIDKVFLFGRKVQDSQWINIEKTFRKKYSDVKVVHDIKEINQIKDEKIILIGKSWDEDLEYLISECGERLIIWENIVPEWGIDVVEKNEFQYLTIKAFANADVKKMGKMFDMITQYKSIATVFGNCQSFFMNRILQHTDKINEKYVICYFPFVQDMKEEKEIGLSEEYLSKISLFIYQIITKDNKFSPYFETNRYILPKLKDDCIRCSIPFVYFKGYFPQYIPNRRYIGKGLNYGDSVLTRLMEDGKNDDEILELIRTKKFFSKEVIEDNVVESLNDLKSRESRCDIKISDYIEKNFRTKRLFYTVNHPITEILVEVMKRVYQFIGMTDVIINARNLPENDAYELLVYKDVKETLKLEFDEKKHYFNKMEIDRKLSLPEYIHEYRKSFFRELTTEKAFEYKPLVLPYLVKINGKMVSERTRSNLIITGKMIFLNFYLTVESDYINEPIAFINPVYAPIVTSVFVANLVKEGNIPVSIHNDGRIVINASLSKNCKGKFMILNASYVMK